MDGSASNPFGLWRYDTTFFSLRQKSSRTLLLVSIFTVRSIASPYLEVLEDEPSRIGRANASAGRSPRELR